MSWYPALISGGCLAVVSSLLIQSSTPATYRSMPFVTLLSSELFLMSVWLTLRWQKERSPTVVRNIRIGLAMGIIGIGVLIISTPTRQEEMPIGSIPFIEVTLKARVIQRKLVSRFHSSKWSIILEVHEMWQKDSVSTRMYALDKAWIQCSSDQPCPVKIGREYVVDGRLQAQGLDGNYLLNQNICSQNLQIRFHPDWKSLHEVEPSCLSPIWEYIGEKRLQFHRFIEARVYEVFPSSERVCQVLLSLCLGISLPYDIQQDIHRAGLDHLFAISGFHFGCVTMALFFLFRKSNEYISLLMALLFSTLFFFLIGPELPSVLRSWIAVVITSLAIFPARSSSPLNTLGVALYLSLIIRPQFLYHIGFQLSFMATGALLLLSGPLQFLFDRYVVTKRTAIEISKMSFIDQLLYMSGRFFVGALSISLSVWLFIIPYTMLFLDGFQPLSFVYNILLTPLFSFALLGALFTFILWSVFPLLSIPFAYGVERLILLAFSLIEATAYTPLTPLNLLSWVFSHSWVTYIAWGLLLMSGVVAHVAWRRGEGVFQQETEFHEGLGKEDIWKACL